MSKRYAGSRVTRSEGGYREGGCKETLHHLEAHLPYRLSGSTGGGSERFVSTASTTEYFTPEGVRKLPGRVTQSSAFSLLLNPSRTV